MIWAAVSTPAIVAVIALFGTILAAAISAYASHRQAKVTREAAAAQSEATLKVAAAQSQAALEVAKDQNKTTHAEGARVRFANWQLRKREVYAELLEAARAHREEPSDKTAESAFFFQAHRAMLFSNKELRDELWKVVDDPSRLREADRWKTLVEALGEDARDDGPAD